MVSIASRDDVAEARDVVHDGEPYDGAGVVDPAIAAAQATDADIAIVVKSAIPDGPPPAILRC